MHHGDRLDIKKYQFKIFLCDFNITVAFTEEYTVCLFNNIPPLALKGLKQNENKTVLNSVDKLTGGMLFKRHTVYCEVY